MFDGMAKYRFHRCRICFSGIGEIDFMVSSNLVALQAVSDVVGKTIILNKMVDFLYGRWLCVIRPDVHALNTQTFFEGFESCL